jgi:DNA polymerase I-like protein with 3'-5' exonuclease and polymerase domains
VGKRWVYAFLYGAGAEKLGAICGKDASYGKRLKQRFMTKLPALNNLIKEVQKVANRGYLKGLDGRQVTVRHAFSSLNTLLQSSGALIAKQWLVNIDDALTKHDLQNKADLVLWIHDEVQVEVEPAYAEQVKDLIIEAAVKAGKDFNFRVQTDAEGKIGNNWAETH